MATDLQHVKPAPAAQAPAAKKHEAFVAQQLARTRTRIRFLDMAAAGLGFVVLTLAYGLVMALCDRWLELSPLARQTAFAVYAAGGLVYLSFLVVLPLCRQINPYYAARRLEQTIPEAKNSVVNWLDLHQQTIAPAFRNAIGHQAAKDLAQADLDQAISARRASWLGAGATALFVSLLVLFVLGPRQFFSLINRAFAPFIEASIATRTRLTLVRPEGGDVTIPVGRAVGFSVWVEGRIPDISTPEALKLLYRHSLTDPYQARLLERGNSTPEWFTNISASEVHNGFWYKVTGGDAATDEYHVQVRSTPLLTGFNVTYHYRPYLGRRDWTTHDQNLQELRGTEVTLLARTNRKVRAGQLIIDTQKPIAGELVREDPQAMRFRLRLEQDGMYRIWFTSVEGEKNIDPMPYTIRVLHDHPPQVELKEPGKDIELPANGLLRLAGSASDDFGIASLNLRLKVESGEALRPKPYRKGEALRRGDGSYPEMLAYHDLIELDKLQRQDGQSLGLLKPEQKIEYWLEATDNCDYPGPNIGESKHFKVTIRQAEPDKNKQQRQRQEAQQDQKKHEKKQDQDLQKQKREDPDRPERQNAPEKKENPQDKESDRPNDENLSKQKERIEDAIKKHEQQEKASEKGEAKGEKPPQAKGEGKGEGQSEQKVDRAQNKEKEKSEGKQQSGQEKGEGNPEARPAKGEQKGEGQSAPRSDGDRGNERGREGAERKSDQETSAGNKGEGKPGPKQNSGQDQAGDKKEPRSQPNESRPSQTRANPESARGDKSGNSGEGTTGQSANDKKEQRPGEGKKEGQGEQKTGQGERKPEPNSGQGAAHEKPNDKKEQNPGEGQKKGAGQDDKKPQAGQENGNTAGEKNDAGAKKSEQKGPGQEGAKQEAGQPKGEGKQGSNAEKGQEKNQNGQSGNQQNGQKKGEGKPESRPGKGQEKGAGQPQAEKNGGSQGESKTDNQAASKSDGKGEGNPGGGEEPKGTAKENATGGSRDGTSKVQEKPAGPDKDDAGNRTVAKGESKDGRPKQGTGEAQGPDKKDSTAQPGPRSAPNNNARAQQPKAEGQGGKEPDKKTKEDISALSNALKNRDERARQDARKRLEELRDKAKDPATRQAAADAMKRASEDTANGSGQQPNGTKPGTGEAAPAQDKGTDGAQNTAAKKSNEEGTGKSDSPKGGAENSEQRAAKGNSGSEAGERGSPDSSSNNRRGSGASGSKGGSEPTPPTPNPGGSREDGKNASPEPDEPETPANTKYNKQAGELQLEDIKKKVNKDVLNQLNMTEEEFQKFVNAYQEMLKRKQASPPEKEKLVGPHQGNRKLPDQRVRLVDPREQGKTGNLQRVGPAFAPPEFREAYKQFSRRISELEQPKEKK